MATPLRSIENTQGTQGGMMAYFERSGPHTPPIERKLRGLALQDAMPALGDAFVPRRCLERAGGRVVEPAGVPS